MWTPFGLKGIGMKSLIEVVTQELLSRHTKVGNFSPELPAVVQTVNKTVITL
jgi:hypothetical protein